jgi:hypothetical protein
MRDSIIRIMLTWKDGTSNYAYVGTEIICIAQNRTFRSYSYINSTVPDEGQPDFALCSYMGMAHIDVL